MFFHFLEALLHQGSCDIDLLGFSVFLHASPTDFNTAVVLILGSSMASCPVQMFTSSNTPDSNDQSTNFFPLRAETETQHCIVNIENGP